jgi:hypothetical protein
MKKLILSLGILVSSVVALSQSAVYTVVKSIIYDYNSYTDNYDVGKTFYPTDMKINRYDNLLIVDDKAHSNYRITDKLESNNEDCLNAVGEDEKSRVVGMSFCRSGSYLVITILYPKQFSVSYYTK